MGRTALSIGEVIVDAAAEPATESRRPLVTFDTGVAALAGDDGVELLNA